jgi:hypothetical protein
MMLRLGYSRLPATVERPEGGEWMLERGDWASRRTMAMTTSSR